MSRLSRRSVLLGGAGLVLGACGSSPGKRTSSATTATGAGQVLPADRYQLVQFFKSGTPPADVAYRLPFGLMCPQCDDVRHTESL